MRLILRLVLTLSLLATIPSLAAAAQSSPVASPVGTSQYIELTITATDTGFEVPASTPAGRHLVTFANTGSAGAGMFFWKLPDGVTLDQLSGSLPTREPGSSGQAPEAFYSSDFPGAPGYAEAGGTTQAIVDLSAGDYAVLTEEGAWATPLHVEAESGTPAVVEDPTVDLEVNLQEYAFVTFPDTLPAGHHVWKVTNIGTQPHQMIVGKVPDGMTFEQVLAGFLPPSASTPVGGAMTRAQFHSVGGIEIMSPGNTVWSLIDLSQPGTYAVVCLVPDEHNGMLHASEGMVSVFTVA